MIAVGLLLIVGGAAGTVWAVGTTSARRRPMDIVAALVAPIAILLALTGGVVVCVPGFLGH
jgi:hypothetical protein